MPRPTTVLRTLALICALLLAGTAAASVAKLEELAGRNPADTKLQFLLGKAYSQQGNHLRAKKVFQDILQRKKAPVVFLHLGLEFAAMGNLTGAILQWTSVIEQKPNDLTAMRLLARALHQQALELTEARDQAELFEQSLNWWKRILRLDPGNLRARYYAGIECFKLGRHEQAAKHWLILLRVKNQHRKTLACLTKALLKLGRIPQARKVCRKILRIEAVHGTSPLTAWATDIIHKIDGGQIGRPEVREPVVQLTTAETASDQVPEYDAATDPEPPPVPRPPKVMPRILDDLQKGKVDLKAENLFLDGLEFKDSGNFEKALFAFLQAIDVDPNFTQVFLQLGEVYLQLAKLASTKAQFIERVALSKQSLDKVKDLSPGSLLSHAAQSKLVLLEKLKRQDFKGYHLQQAHAAIKEGREDDSFDEYLLLLSNLYLEPGIFLELGAVTPKLSATHRQDLQYFAEELYQKHKGNPWIEYLLGKVYLTVGQAVPAEDALNRFLEHTDPKADPEAFATYVKFIDYPKVANLDRYLGARLLLKIDQTREARKLVEEFVKAAVPTDLFYKDGSLLADQLKRAQQTSTATAAVTGFADELKDLTTKVPSTRVLFGTHLSASHLDDALLKSVELYVDSVPDNSLARFVLAWLSGVRATSGAGDRTPELRKRSEELFHDVLSRKTSSPEWHFTMGLQGLLWELRDRGMAHLRLVGDILLARGLVDCAPFADRLLVEARRFDDEGHGDVADELLRQADLYAPSSLQYNLVRAGIEWRRGAPVSALGNLVDWLGRALTESWIRSSLLADLGLMAFLAVMAALLVTATALAAKYIEPLHHFIVEFVTTKGAFLSVGLVAMAGAFLVFFSTGLIVFLPALMWPMMRDREKSAFLILLCMVLLIPLLLPVSFFDNFDLIRHVESLRSGDLETARPYFTALAAERPLDQPVQYATGLIKLRDGDLEAAREIFTKLRTAGETEGVLVNLGVIAARSGDHTGAVALFQKALSLEARSIEALFDISSVYAFQGQQDKADQYLRWAKSLAVGEERLDRFRAIPSSVATLVLMDAPLDLSSFSAQFSFFSTANFFRLNANLIGFLTWFIIGGGLVGLLLFLRERMDIVLGRCNSCHAVTCNLCQKVLATRAYCDSCAEGQDGTPTLPPDARQAARDVRRRKALNVAYVATLVLPGSGPIFTGQPGVAALCQTGFWISLQATLGGWILLPVLARGPGASTLGFFHLLAGAVALFWYLLGLTLLHRRREEIEWL